MSPSHHYKTSVKLLTGLKLQTISIIFLLIYIEISCEGGAGIPDGGVREEDADQVTPHHGQCLHHLHDVLIRHRSMFMTRFISPRCTTSHFCLGPLNSSLRVSDTLLPPSAHIYQLFITYLQSCTTDIYN